MTPIRCAEYVPKNSPQYPSEYPSEDASERQRTAACHRQIRHAVKHNSKA